MGRARNLLARAHSGHTQLEGRQGSKTASVNLFRIVRAASPVAFGVLFSRTRSQICLFLLRNSAGIRLLMVSNFSTTAWVTSLGASSRSGPDELRISSANEDPSTKSLRFWAL